MALILRIESGPQAGTTLALGDGKPLTVGRSGRADHAVPDDNFLSGVHFEVRLEGNSCLLTDRNSSNGTYVEESRIRERQLAPGSRFTAGQTEFSITVEAVAPEPVVAEPAASAPVAAPQATSKPATLSAAARERLLQQMRTTLHPLYAVLDAAHDSRVLALLSQHKCEYICLFHPEKAPELVRFAPFVVALPPASPAIEPLVDLGWGKDWGIYLIGTAGSGAEMIQLLRNLLTAVQPDGQQVLLRYYDPRVLRKLLANAPQQQWNQFFGAVRSYLVADEDPENAVGFAMGELGLERHTIPLVGDKPSLKEPVLAPGVNNLSAGSRVVLSAQQMAAFQL